MAYLTLGCRCLVGVVFAVSAFTKLRSRPAFGAFSAWLSQLPLPVVRRCPVGCAAAIAGTETLVAALVALPWTAVVGLSLGAVALGALAAGAFVVARAGSRLPCHCFGASDRPLGMRHVVRDALLCLVTAAGAVVSGPVARQPVGTVLAIGVGVAVAVFAIFFDDIAGLIADSAAPLDLDRSE